MTTYHKPCEVWYCDADGFVCVNGVCYCVDHSALAIKSLEQIRKNEALEQRMLAVTEDKA